MTGRPARLWLARHAAPVVAPGLCYGSLDVPADAQATADAARRLADALPRAPLAVSHSPLQRCAQLAQALQAARPDLDPRPDARLAEMDFGRWEGLPWSRIDRSAIDAWTADFHGHAPGGGESLAQMMGRVDAALSEVLHGPGGSTGPATTEVLWITHAGVARCVRWRLAHPGRLPRADEWPATAPGLGEWDCIDLPWRAGN
ncbi:histidine phosphatase family protein [Acidovorax sp. GBBC 3334]|uniref:histidine phosphatase family protein n=1 Tax=Acidovorax sp. GBBC 3334 TaxID=2940496 RepID=UPI0023036541|nr:histidine phosphatase family protein [Acidovorax sp. GBBC 3334]MDA8454032.1 histidine phosphatase family protein [Acidovorax sp. GBBC 3334]